MEIQNRYYLPKRQPSFEAKLIKKTNIEKLAKWGYQASDAFIVALKKEDLPALKKVTEMWNEPYSNHIYRSASENLRPVNLKFNVFAITKQSENFKTLDPTKILGLCEFENKCNYNEINMLQINPKYTYKKTGNILIDLFNLKSIRKYKKIGSKILDFLKEKTKDTPIKVYSDCNCHRFYIKNSFSKIKNTRNEFIWNP